MRELPDADKEKLMAKIQAIITELGENPTFVSAIEKIYASGHLLLSDELQQNKRKLSSGVSDIKAYDQYLQVVMNSIKDHANYRNYAAPQGAEDARAALAILETTKFDGKFKYTADNFCITEGATGAISSLFEYIKKIKPEGELLIPSPSYYVFKLCATQHGIACTEVPPQVNEGTPMVSVDAILGLIAPRTKIIAITQPNNPTGEIYKPEEIERLLKVAVEKDILVISDELFSDLIMDTSYRFTASDKIAHDLDGMKNVVCIKAYSKNRNLPGFRIGYLYSIDSKLIEGVTKAQEQRAFCASGSNFKELVILDSFYQTAGQLHDNVSMSVGDAISQTLKQYKEAHITLPLVESDLHGGYIGFREYMKATLHYYQKGLDTIKEEMGQTIDFMPDTKAAFNTIVRMKVFDKVNLFDFCLNLFLFYGVKTQVGPYFGFTQKVWQDELGFWLRISFSMDSALLKDASERVMKFKESYLRNPDKFIHLNYEFN